MNNFEYNPTDSKWHWHLANITDCEDMLTLTETQFQQEIDQIYSPDREHYLYQLNMACLCQAYDPGQQLIALARDLDHKLIAYHWAWTNATPLFSRDLTVEVRICHIDQNLPKRQALALCSQSIAQWIRWANIVNAKVIVSSTIRSDQQGFLKLHERQGFTLRGSIAYLKLEN